jgi:hypothetical protein
MNCKGCESKKCEGKEAKGGQYLVGCQNNLAQIINALEPEIDTHQIKEGDRRMIIFVSGYSRPAEDEDWLRVNTNMRYRLPIYLTFDKDGKAKIGGQE